MTYKLIIVDDHPIVRRGLRQLIDAHSDLEVCGEASGVDEAFELVTKLHPRRRHRRLVAGKWTRPGSDRTHQANTTRVSGC